MAVGDAYVFPGFLKPVLTQLFFPKPPTTFLTCFCRGERRKYAGKKSHLNRVSNSQPPGHESDTLTTEPPGRGLNIQGLWVNSKLILSKKTKVCSCTWKTNYRKHKWWACLRKDRNNSGKRRKCWLPGISPISVMFSMILDKAIHF